MKNIKCPSCSCENLSEILKLGEIPLAGEFPRFEDLPIQSKHDCNLLICDCCGLVQIDTIIKDEALFKDYRYLSSISLSKHFADVAKILYDKFDLKDKKVVEIGSNDGVLLKPLMELGVDCLGFEPSINVSEVAKQRGCNVINDFFNFENCRKYNISKIDLIIANNVFAHIYEINSVVKGIKSSLKDDGVFVAEVHYLLDLVNRNQYDFIYHEHIFYHSLYALTKLFKSHSMTLFDFDLIDVHSGSIRIYVKNYLEDLNRKITKQIEIEVNSGITTKIGMSEFSKKVNKHINDCRDMINTLIPNSEIIGFGASGRGNVFSNLLKLNTSHIKYIFDESPERTNRFIPSCNIPIVRYTNEYVDKEYDIVLIFAWNYSNMIMNKIKSKQYLIMFPEPTLISKNNITNIKNSL